MAGGLSILDLTTTEEALRCAGLSEYDLGHQSFLDSMPENDLKMDLHLRVPTFQAMIEAGKLSTATLAEQMLLLALKNYARWFCAVLLCKRWNGILQLKSDGKTRGDRFDRMDLEKMLAQAEGEKAKAWASLVLLLPEEMRPVRRFPTLFGVSSPTTDIITEVATRE